MSITEVIIFPGTQVLLREPSLIDTVLGDLKATGHTKQIVKGFGLEEKEKLHLFITWTSQESYKAVTHLPAYHLFMESINSLAEETPTIYHVNFDVDASGALTAPITEIGTFSPKEGHTLEEVTAATKKMQAIIPQYPGIYGLPIGASEQLPGQNLVCIGWESVEAHAAAGKSSPMKELLYGLLPLANTKFTHANLQAY